MHFTLIWAYLPLIALILPYVPYSINVYSSIEYILICKISKNWGIQKCHHEHSLGVNLVTDNFVYVVSDTSPLYKI